MITSIRKHSFAFLLSAMAIVVILVSVYSMRTAHRIADVHAPLVSATLDIKVEMTEAHLLFEELVSGDDSIAMADVYDKMSDAEWYVRAMIAGGENEDGVYIPIDDAELKANLQVVEASIQALTTLMAARLAHKSGSELTSEIEGDFDQYYHNIAEKTGLIERQLQALIMQERFEQRISNYTGLLLLVILLVSIIYHSITQRRKELALLKQLNDLATHDELTSIANRRSFNAALTRAWDHALRSQIPISLALCDIDSFKTYNDTLGHPAGDVCLQSVAQVMMGILKRTTDSVARYGGEEFVFIFHGTAIKGAAKIIEKLHSDLYEKNIHHPASDVSDRVSISVGVASLVPTKDLSIKDFIASADKALYQAKKEGRNRTVAVHLVGGNNDT